MGRPEKRRKKQKNRKASKKSLKNSVPKPHFPINSAPAKKQVALAASKVGMSVDISQELNKAVELHEAGQPHVAREIYEDILVADPNQSDALHLLGLLHYQSNEPDEAVALIERALDQLPGNEIYLNSLATVYRDLGRLDDAREINEQLLADSPEQWKLLLNLAKTLNKQENHEAALKKLRLAQRLKPDDIDIEFEFGMTLMKLFQFQSSKLVFRHLLELQPDHLNAAQLLGCCLYHLEEYTEAIEFFEDVLQRKPDFAAVWSNCGACHQSLARFEKAKECYEKAIELNPRLADAYNNLANVLQYLSDLEGAEANYQKALELQPDYIEPQFSLGEIDLLKGRFQSGWERYKLRLKKRLHDHRAFDHPEWNGQPTTEKVLAFSEQGIGDVAMFASCLPDFLQDCPNCVLEVDLRMVELFQRSFPSTRVVPRSKLIPDQVTVTIPDVQQQVSLGELPAVYRPSLQSYPGDAYLVADEASRKKWRARFDELGAGLKVGISWRGGKNIEVQAKRSAELSEWAKILTTDGVHFINLQYGDCEEDRAWVRDNVGVEIHDWDDADPKENLDDFAAQMSELDLVISIDNATVHFAGALGVPCWAMLAKLPDWRWMLDSHTSHWYGSLRLFRQVEALNWTTVFSDVQHELATVRRNPAALSNLERRIDRSSESPNGTKNSPAIRLRNATLTCGVITPVGPGHAAIYEENLSSLKSACETGSGKFTKIMPIRINDLEGNSGRSYARNFGVRQAEELGCDWIFFLDADDVMSPQAFENVAPFLDKYDAIWGQIYSFQDGSQEAEWREDQLGQTDRFEDILLTDPFLSLQMGHFVRTNVALKTQFHEGMNTGEDFHYYLRLWERHRCIKVDQPFFANRRGRHSTGPRSATGRQWMQVVHALMEAYRQKHFNGVDLPDELTIDFTPEVPMAESKPVAASKPTTPVLQAPAPTKPFSDALSQPSTGSPSQPFVRRLDPLRPEQKTTSEPRAEASTPSPEQHWREGWDPREKIREILSPYVRSSALQIGCGDGGLCESFSAEFYRGVDANQQAIEIARQKHPDYQFAQYGFDGRLPQADACFAYTFLLHVSDDALHAIVKQLCDASHAVLVGEILGRKWRQVSRDPIFNREAEEYDRVFQAEGFRRTEYREYSYQRYADTNLSFLLFTRDETRHS